MNWVMAFIIISTTVIALVSCMTDYNCRQRGGVPMRGAWGPACIAREVVK